MNRYKLSLLMHQPGEDTEDKYMAEIPALPGWRAWGDTPAETLHILEGVAEAQVQSYLEHSDPLSAGVMTAPLIIGAY